MYRNLDLYQQIRVNNHTTWTLELSFFILTVIFCNLIISCLYGALEYLFNYMPKFISYADTITGNESTLSTTNDPQLSTTIKVLTNFVQSLPQLYVSQKFLKFQILETILLLISVGVYMIYRIHNATDISIKNVNGKIINDVTDYPIIQNLVNNMAIAANIMQPTLFIIPDDSLNATAVGTTPQNSAIGLTQGLIDALTPNEINGVIAHEVSHIKFHDTQVFTIGNALQSVFLMTAYFGIYCLRLFTKKDKINKINPAIGAENKYSLTSSNDGLNSENASTDSGIGLIVYFFFGISVPFIITLGILLELIAWPAYVISYILQVFVIKDREYLADAESINFTRNPTELISALDKISHSIGMDKENTACNSLYIDDPSHSGHKFLDFHPPMSKRIAKLNNMM